MANCKNCGAGLPAKAIECPYCGSRQDVDLHGIHRFTIEVPESDRICPRCNKAMPTLDLKLQGKFLIERCETCMGMFFDPGELEALLDKSVSNVYFIDYDQLKSLKTVKRHNDYPITYIKCPICKKLMNRINFGSQSGVIVDKCKGHGVWLDGGELRRLMEWIKAGGKLHHQQKELEFQKMKQQKERSEISMDTGQITTITTNSGMGQNTFRQFSRSGRNFNEPDDLFSLVSEFVGKLFR